MTDILFAAPLSLYSGKVRAYLDWKDIDYHEQLATPDIMRDIIIPQVGRPVIPVVQLADGTLLQDSTLIIDHYEAIAPSASIYPSTALQRMVALLFELYGDEWLVIPAMHYRWHYNEDWVHGEFGKVALPASDRAAQLAAGKTHAAKFQGFVPMLGITPDTKAAIETSYEALLHDLDRHFDIHEYLLGSRPSIGDFGLIGPLYAHLYRDPASGDLMKRLAPNVARWVERMVDVKSPASGSFLCDDVIPPTLLPILRRMMIEQLPHLQLVAQAFASWAVSNDAAPVPRSIGMAPFTVEGVTGTRIASPFSLWMLQRPLDAYRALEGSEKTAADALLEQIDGAVFQDFNLPQRTDFLDHRVTVADTRV